jgi:DNA-binding transcriptional MerR regulator
LRHYHAIGLLEPSWTADGGRRHYGQEELLRLQQILLFRNLGLGLDAIAQILQRQDRADAVAVLGRHRAWLIEEGKRLRRLVRTVETTMETLERAGDMTAEKIFEGFEHNPYEAEARERWGDETFDAKARMQGWTDADAEKARTGYDRIHAGLRPLLRDGVHVADARVQELVRLHYEVTSLFWTPGREAYIGLGRMYGRRIHRSAGVLPAARTSGPILSGHAR